MRCHFWSENFRICQQFQANAQRWSFFEILPSATDILVVTLIQSYQKCHQFKAKARPYIVDELLPKTGDISEILINLAKILGRICLIVVTFSLKSNQNEAKAPINNIMEHLPHSGYSSLHSFYFNLDNALEKRFKICHIFVILKPIQFFHFLLPYFSLMNA